MLLGININLCTDLFILAEVVQAVLQTILERVSHGHELDVRVGRQCLSRRAGAAVATADQADPERVAARGVNAGEGGQGAGGQTETEETHGVMILSNA